MAKILLADDHPMVRAGVRELLEEDCAASEIGESTTGTETLERLRVDHWDLVILDINMPHRSGLDILRDVRARHPDTKVLILSSLPERQYAINVLKAGASGYLSKECAPQDIVQAVQTTLQGGRYLSSKMADVLVSDLEGGEQRPLHRLLSEREFQVFQKLAAGSSVSTIAEELFLSAKTISSHRVHILEKMNLATNADLIAYALQNGIIE